LFDSPQNRQQFEIRVEKRGNDATIGALSKKEEAIFTQQRKPFALYTPAGFTAR